MNREAWFSLEELMLLYKRFKKKILYVLRTIIGNAPLTLENAYPMKIESIIQAGKSELAPKEYLDTITQEGKCEQPSVTRLSYVNQIGICEQASTPTMSNPVPIKCNNGTLTWDAVNHQVTVSGTAEVITDAAGNTVTVANLFGLSDALVGGYVDSQNILTGQITRQIQTIVLTGTEMIMRQDAGVMSVDVGAYVSGKIICTHFVDAESAGYSEGSALADAGGLIFFVDPSWYETDFANWLSTQYNNGSPVIVLVGGGNGQETVAPQTLTTLPLTATGSVNVQSGLRTSETTVTIPTPETPLDIKCNNGVLRIVDDDLPSGYTRLTYIESDGTDGHVTTGIVIDSVDTDVEVDFQLLNTSASQPKMLWGYMAGSSNIPRWGFGIYSTGWLGSPNATASRGPTDADRHTAIMRVYERNGASYYSGTVGETELYGETALGNVQLFEANVLPLVLFARNNKGTVGNFANAKIFRFKVTKANVLTHDLVPCKDDGGALGFYDLVTETFLAGTGTLAAGAVDYSHTHVGIVGTPEVLSVGGKNINGGTIENKGYTSTGGESTSTTFAGTLWKIPCEEGQKFTASWGGFPDGVSGVFVNTWKTDGTWNMRQAISAGTSLTYTVGAGIGTVNFTLYKTGGITIGDNAWLQVEYGTSATDYEPYRTPQTASVVNLLAVGDYKDVQEIIGGAVTRKVGIKVFDGTETITYFSSSGRMSTVLDGVPKTTVPIICTHFPDLPSAAGSGDYYANSRSANNLMYIYNVDCTSEADYKAFFAAQYAAGTPVIVVYPLAEETTETVAPQISDRNLPVTVTYTAEIDDITITTTQSVHTTPSPNTPLDILCNNGTVKAVNGQVTVDGTAEVLTVSADGAENQTATVANLFAIGDYQDVQDIISGAVKRNVGIKVLDGTESVSASGAGWAIAIADKLRSKVEILCSHYPYSSATMANAPDKSIIAFSSQNIGIKDSTLTSASAVQAFLAAQYAAGTPVIVVYPLAEEAAETVTPQALTTSEGDNIIAVSSNVDPVYLEVEYYEAAS